MSKEKRIILSLDEKIKRFNLVLDYMLEGMSVKKACEKAVINYNSFFNLINKSDSDKDRINAYARAREYRCDIMAEDIIDIADDGTNDYYEDENGNIKTDHENINRSRLRVDARKWVLSKIAPKKYGDKIDLTTNGEQINNSVNITYAPPIEEE